MSSAYEARLISLWDKLRKGVKEKREERSGHVGIVPLQHDRNLQRIEELQRNILNAIDEREDIASVVRAHFYHDVWHGEVVPDLPTKMGDSVEAVLGFEEGDTLDVESYLKDNMQWTTDKVERTITKLRNLRTALLDMEQHQANTQLKVDWVKRVHYVVMQGLLDNAGEFRKKNAEASRCSVVYARPSAIEERLCLLLKFCGDLWKTQLSFSDRFVLGVLFFSEFLLIHPFSNGNGRVARLIWWSVWEKLTIPLSFDGRKRKEYIDLLDQRAWAMEAPVGLAHFMADEVRASLERLWYLIM